MEGQTVNPEGTPITLREALSQKKPQVLCDGIGPGNTTNKNWPKVNVSIWREFQLSNLVEAYGHILDAPFDDDNFPKASGMLAGLSVRALEDLAVFFAWNDTILERAVEFARGQLHLFPGVALIHKHMLSSISTPSRTRKRPFLLHLG